MTEDFFDWVKDIEETYKYLIEEAKNKNKQELDNFKSQQEELLEHIIKKKKQIVKKTLKSLSKEIELISNTYKIKFNSCLKIIRNTFKENKQKLLNNIIKKLNFEF